MSNSSYHKGEWSSTWNIKSILIAFYSIWLDDKEYGISHIKDSKENRLKMANESIEYNKKNNLKIYNDFNFSHLKDFEEENKKETKTTELNNEIINEDIKIINKNIEIINEKIGKQEENIQNLEKQINNDK